MEDQLLEMRHWATRGTVRQFFAELSARVSTNPEYQCEMTDEESIACYRIRKEGGFLGIGAKTVREPVLEIYRHGEEVTIPEETADAEFLSWLMEQLQPH
jgi:hypothetical protein